jgi:hypothetical protein
MTEAVLYSFLLRKGVLNLSPSTRHNKFFKNLIEACRTEEGRKVVEEYVHSDSENPPDLTNSAGRLSGACGFMEDSCGVYTCF